jgi:hypothetical protein
MISRLRRATRLSPRARASTSCSSGFSRVLEGGRLEGAAQVAFDGGAQTHCLFRANLQAGVEKRFDKRLAGIANDRGTAGG